jgi:hypothetical protein
LRYRFRIYNFWLRNKRIRVKVCYGWFTVQGSKDVLGLVAGVCGLGV